MPIAHLASTGLFVPPHSISNEELVASFNLFVERFNQEHAVEISRGERAELEPSSASFIEKASGIRSRFVMDKDGILDPERMCPKLAPRCDEELSLLAEIAVAAAGDALETARCDPATIDAVIVACSNLQRAYPAVAIEVQQALGLEQAFAFDMNVACSSATFGIQAGYGLISAGAADRVLVCNPEICSGHLDFRDRDAHFIFGDVATAMLLQRDPPQPAHLGSHDAHQNAGANRGFEILGLRCKTRFSNNIRNNFGFLNRTHADHTLEGPSHPPLFRQNGRRVFKEVSPMVADLILDHLDELGLEPNQLKRMWLHQANLNMNQLIARRVLGREASPEEAPIILDRFANTSSAGSVIALHQHHADFECGDLGLLCSFGAGYSIGSVVLRKA